MALIVQKFGGSSVANAERILHVAEIVTNTYKKGNQVVVVLSAQGDTTDDLLEKAAEINPSASKREMDMLLSTGEQISVALCAMALEAMGLPCARPEGAFYVFPSIGSRSSEDFCLRLIQDAGVAAVPGTVFGAEGYVRMSYCCSMEHLQEAMDRLERFLQLSQ